MIVFSCSESEELYLQGQKNQNIIIDLTYNSPYYEATVSLKFYRIDSWDKDEDYFTVLVNGQICISKTYTFERYIFQNIECGSSKYDESIENIICSVKTNEFPIKVELKANLDQDIEDESWAFREFQVSINLCPFECLSCQNSTVCNTCKSGYYLTISKSCQKCDSICAECINSSSLCTKCNPSTYLYNNQCLKSCPPGYYKNVNTLTCDICFKNCLSCQTGVQCDICSKGYFRTADQKCVQQCQGSFYGDPLTQQCQLDCSNPSYFQDIVSKECKQCDGSCLTCNKIMKNCVTCPPNTFIHKTQCTTNCQLLENNMIQNCVSSCPQQQFFADTNKMECISCYKGCKVCSGENFDQCSECNSDHTQINNKCIRQDCGLYYFANVNTNMCQRCQLYCITCTNESSCNQCVKDQDTSGICLNPCSPGQYFYSDNCLACDKNCKECFGPNSNQCLDCEPEKTLSSGICICKQGYYDQINSQGISICLKCEENCQECKLNSQGKVDCITCLIKNMEPLGAKCECKDGFIFDQSQCKCQNNYFEYKNQCQPCDSSCKSCNGPSISDCIECQKENQEINSATKICTCKKNYYFNENLQRCEKCYLTCETCLSNENKDCYSCLHQSGLNFVDHLSLTSKCECSQGSYFDIIELKCLPCSPQCRLCNGSTSQNCLSCSDPLMILKNFNSDKVGTCECEESYFYNFEYKQCQKCHYSCNQCTGASDNNCQSCNDPNAELISNKCQCRQGYFFDNAICQQCHLDCKSCHGPNQTDCTVCSSPDRAPSKQLFDKGKCVCQDGLYSHPTKGCIKCFGKCKKCDGQLEENCLDCQEGPNFIKNEFGKCVCENGFYEPYSSTSQHTCLECNKLCSQCDRNGKCITCKTQLMQFTKDKSSCECIKGYTLFENQCVQCPLLCSKCSFLPDQKLPVCLECNDSRTMQKTTDSSKCQCKKQYYPYGDSCNACSPLCKSCNGSTDKDCIICSDETKMSKDINSGICICKEPLIFDYTTGKCVFGPEKQCKESKCLKCNESECFKCISNYLPFGESCLCKDGYYDKGEKQGCSMCEQDNCQICKSALACEVCEQGLLTYQGHCFCPDSKFKDPQNQCSSNCPSKCKMCLDPLQCFLTKEEADKNNYKYCDLSCEKCSGPSYYNCWECSSPTRIYNPTLRICYCKEGFKEIYEKDCQQADQSFNQIQKGISISSGLFTFATVLFSTLIESSLQFSDISGFSSLFLYSISQYQSIGNLVFVNKVYPMEIEQNLLSSFLKMNFFNNIPNSYTPLNDQTGKLNRLLNSSENDEENSTNLNIEQVLFNNPKFTLNGLDSSFFTVSFYPMILIFITYAITGFLSVLSKKSQFAQKVYEKVKWNLNLKIILLFGNICLLSAFVNLKYITDYSSSSKINIISVSIFSALYFGGLLYLLYKINWSSLILNPIDYISYSCLHSKICQESIFSKNFWLLIELRKIFQLVILVTVSIPLPCVITISSISILISVIFLIKRPFLTRQMNFFFIIQEIILIILYLSLSIFVTISSASLFFGYVLIFTICTFQINSLFGVVYFVGKWIIQCRSSKRSSLEFSATQGLVKTIQGGGNVNPTSKQSLEMPDLKESMRFDKGELDFSFKEIDQSVKWNKNPLLFQPKSLNKQKSQNSTGLTLLTKKNSQLSSTIIKGQNTFKFKFQE